MYVLSNPFLRFIFLFAVMLSLFLGSVWYWVAVHPMAFMDVEYPMWKVKSDMLNECKLGVLTILGDSKAVAGIDPNRLGAGTVNLAVGGAQMLEVLAESKKIVACSNPPKAVIISMTFTRFNYETTCCQWTRDIKFGLLGITARDLDEERKRARHYKDMDVFGTFSPFDMNARLEIYLYTMKFPSYSFASLVNGGFNQRWQNNKRWYADTWNNKGQHNFGMASSNDMAGPFGLEHFAPPPLQLSLWEDVLKLYQAKGIPVYFIGPPYKENDVKLISPVLRADIENFFTKYEKLYSCFHVVGDLLPVLPNDDFGDATHVNPKGTKTWTDHVARLLDDNHIEH